MAFYARQEGFGWLLFDTAAHAYLCPNTGEALEATRIVVEEGRRPALEELGADRARGAEALARLERLGIGPAAVRVATRTPRADGLSAPLNVYFDYTSVCNLRCAICYDEPKRAGLKRQTELTPEEVDGVFAQLRDAGVFRVDLAGGEPLLFPDHLLAYLDGARSRQISVSMTTNGLQLSRALSARILERDLKTVTISIDGPDARTNDRFRGPGSFDRAVAGIANLVAVRRETGAGTRIAIKCTFRPDMSRSAVARFVALGRDLGVDKVKFNPLRPTGAVSDDRSLIADPDNYYRVLAAIDEAAGAEDALDVSGPVNPVVCSGGRIPHLTGWGCIAANELMTIDSQGNVRPCSMMNDFVVGNVRHHRFADIYRTPRLDSLRHGRDEDCFSCSAFATCRGGCRIRSQAAGRFLGRDPLCPADQGLAFRPAPPLPAFDYLGLPHSL